MERVFVLEITVDVWVEGNNRFHEFKDVTLFRDLEKVMDWVKKDIQDGKYVVTSLDFFKNIGTEDRPQYLVFCRDRNDQKVEISLVTRKIY